MQKLTLVFALLFVSQIAMAQTSPVVSSLPNAGAAVGVVLNNGQVNFSVLFVDKFSSPNQSNGDDILTITFGAPFSGLLSCLQNLGSGQFAQPVLSQTITWPVYAAQVLYPATGTVLVISNATNVTAYSFSNCVATQISQVAIANVNSISDFIPGSQNFLVSCNGTGVAVETVALSNSACSPFPTSNIVVTGAFPSPYQFAGVQIVPSGNAEISLGSIASDGTIVSYPAALTSPLTGSQFLGCVFPSSGVVCFSANGSAVYVQPLLTDDLGNNPPSLAFTTTQIFDVPESPQMMLSGNLLGSNDGGVDIAFLGSDSVFQYGQNAGEQTWALLSTLVAPAGSDLTGFAVGSLVSGEIDPVTESGLIKSNLTNTNNESAVVWSSVPASEENTSAAQITSPGTMSCTVGTACSFTITVTGTPSPQVWTLGFPAGVGLSFSSTTNTISGVPSAGSQGIYQFSITADNQVNNPAVQSFVLNIATNIVPVGLTIVNANMNEGSVTESPKPPSQVGCPSVQGNCFDVGQTVTLTATPDAGFVFVSWTGACSGSNPVCVLSIVAGPTLVVNVAWAPAGDSITVAPTQQSGTAGGTFTYQVSTVGITNPTLSASCSIPHGTCSISNGTLSVSTMGASQALATRYKAPLSLVAVLGMILLCLPQKQRKTAFCLGTLLVLSACGAGSGSQATKASNSTPAGSYTIALSATGSGSTKVSATAMLTIE